MAYDMIIHGPDDWGELVKRKLDIVVDPTVLRLGQFFLEGAPPAGDERTRRWQAIESDIGALVSFFDLIVLRDQLPAFNYQDTFDLDLNFGDRLGAVLNTAGDKTLVHVDVEYQMYIAAKKAALEQLRKRLQEGPLVSQTTADDILATLDAIQYQWEPSLEQLETEMTGLSETRITRFLLGELVFAGYAQQTGAPHVLAPRRSLLAAAVGLRTEGAVTTSEAAIYAELGRRLRDAGAGWRNDELPWSPSFLPLLLRSMDRFREGPDVLLQRAKDLRSSKAVERYRKIHEALASENAERSAEARRELEAAASEVARSLGSSRQELHLFRQIAVEVLPQAVGVVGGTLVGTLVAGVPGAVGGGLAGVAGERVLRAAHEKLWGWLLDGLPFRSARKLLARSVRSEREMQSDLARLLYTVWETGRQAL